MAEWFKVPKRTLGERNTWREKHLERRTLGESWRRTSQLPRLPCKSWFRLTVRTACHTTLAWNGPRCPPSIRLRLTTHLTHVNASEVTMRATGFDTVIGHTPGPQSQAIVQFCVDPKLEARRTTQSPLMDSMVIGRRARLDRLFPFVASSLIELIETARRELERDQEAAKTSLATASRILNAEVECHSSDACLPRRGLAAWQVIRVRTM
jgi:hypothetical protein